MTVNIWIAPHRALKLGYWLIVTAGLYTLFAHWAYDDPFITYRYAQNLDHGLGFVYNPGERVLSTTTPLFTLSLAFFGLFWPDLPKLANLIGAGSLALGGILLWDLARAWEAPFAGWAGLLLYPCFPLLLTTLGSETPLYLAFCLGAFASYARKGYSLAALLAALAVLARPDGILVAALLAGDFVFLRRGPIPWRALGIFAGLLLAWAAFSWSYFGSPVPVTLAAKQGQGAMAISERFASGFLTILRWYSRWPYPLEAMLATAGALFVAWKARAWLLFLAWPVLYFAAYSALGVSRYFWYYAPLVPGFIVAAGLGIEAIGRLWPTTVNEPAAPGGQPAAGSGRPIPLIGFALLVLLSFGQVRSLMLLRKQADPRFEIYRAVGEWLQANTGVEARVGALEVGIIGYYASRPMVDFAGLIQPQVAAQFNEQTDYEDAALWAVRQYRPDYLVLPQGSFPRLEQNFTDTECNLAERFPGDLYDYPGILNVYACRN